MMAVRSMMVPGTRLPLANFRLLVASPARSLAAVLDLSFRMCLPLRQRQCETSLARFHRASRAWTLHKNVPAAQLAQACRHAAFHGPVVFVTTTSRTTEVPIRTTVRLSVYFLLPPFPRGYCRYLIASSSSAGPSHCAEQALEGASRVAMSYRQPRARPASCRRRPPFRKAPLGTPCSMGNNRAKHTPQPPKGND